MKRRNWMMGSILALSAMVALAGCQTSQTSQAAPEPVTAPAPAPAPVMAPQSGTVSAMIAIPTGDKATSGMLIEKVAPAEVSAGQTFTYSIVVTNLTKVSLQDVTVTDKLPDDYKLDSADPRAEVSSGQLIWNLGTLAPREARKITVTGSGSKVGTLTNCVTGSYALAACVATNVTQPALKLEKTVSPDTALKCDPITELLTVTNNGTGVSRNVKIVDQLPAGLTTADGKQAIEIMVGDLSPGAAKSFKTALKATQTGKLESTATATADGGLKSQAADGTTVLAPALTLTKTGPKKEFVGRQLTYDLVVTNNGDGPAKNTMVSDGVPVGTTFVSATDSGAVESGSVVWKLGTLDAGKSKKLTLVVRADQIATVKNAAAASADCADAVTARAETEVVGIPAVLLEVVDNPDLGFLRFQNRLQRFF